jgi:hypothetical protein
MCGAEWWSDVLNVALSGGLIEVLNPVLNGGVMC